MHLESGGVDEEPRADEFVMLRVIAKHVAHVLTQKALDALAKLLHAIDVLLRHSPGAVGGVRFAGLELFDAFFYLVTPRDVRDEVLDRGERTHRLDRHWFCDV